MLCPVCDVELKMSDRKGVEIDYCPKCRGVWLDRGELDKIIDRSNKYYARVGDEYDNDKEKREDPQTEHYQEKAKRGHENKKRDDKKKKRDSILEDIFDIFD